MDVVVEDVEDNKGNKRIDEKYVNLHTFLSIFIYYKIKI